MGEEKQAMKTISRTLLLLAMAGAEAGCTLIDGTPKPEARDEWPPQLLSSDEKYKAWLEAKQIERMSDENREKRR